MKPRYEFEIIVENKVVWRGLNLKSAYDKTSKKYPNKKVGIAWKSKDNDIIIYLC